MSRRAGSAKRRAAASKTGRARPPSRRGERLGEPDRNPCVDPLTRQRREWPCRRSEEHTSELQSLMRISYAVSCLKKQKLYQLNYSIIHRVSTRSSLVVLTETKQR